MSETCRHNSQSRCILSVHDAMDVLGGKWKVSIIASVQYYEKRRFSDILNDVPGISNKMLSKELKDLELNKLMKRTVLNTQPISVQYELTEYGKSLHNVIVYLSEWGLKHRETIL